MLLVPPGLYLEKGIQREAGPPNHHDDKVDSDQYQACKLILVLLKVLTFFDHTNDLICTTTFPL